PALAPGCDISRLEEALMLAPAGTAVMVVGHEPDLSELIEILSGARVVMRKGGLARLTLMSLSARYATLTWLLPAKILRAAG
ncbi:MAG TPA: phosphohistidine phosphatase SixA, partial [Roseiflexaceae bacterium]|nr:phosphohistidine phosphatase SixA [Roseiflexaceae bacterium]